MTNLKHLMTLIGLSLGLISFGQQPFTAGNFVVYRLGTGAAALGSSAAAVFLEEYTPSGTLVQTIAMPTAVSGANNILTGRTGSNTGQISLSADGRYIVVAGLNVAPGAGSSGTASVIGLVDYNAAINTSTAITDFVEFPSNRVSSAASDNGTNLWFGAASSSAIRYTTVGSSTSVLLNSSTIANFLTVSNNQLYSGDGNGIYTVGAGLPTSTGQSLTLLPGLTGLVSATGQFAFADLDPSTPGDDVLYVASANSTTNNAIKKFSLVSGNWVPNGFVGNLDNTDHLYNGLAISISGTSVTLYATMQGANSQGNKGGSIVKLVDNSGYNGTIITEPTPIVDITTRFAANTAAFRGLALVPQRPPVKVSIKAYLQGAYNSSLNRHKDVTTTWANILNANALSQPYNVAPFSYAGTETVSSGFFTSNAGSNTDILDWVLVELRDASNVLVTRRAAFIREDGQIVDTDGSSAVTFTGVDPANYYVVVRHRNHLSVRSASTLALSATTTNYDFTTGLGQAFTNGSISNTPMATKDLLGATTSFTMLWGGNANSDGLVRASAGANVNDYLTLMSPANLNGNTSTILNNVYRAVDMNLDGVVRASAGSNVNDYLVLMSPGILNGNTSNIITSHN